MITKSANRILLWGQADVPIDPQVAALEALIRDRAQMIGKGYTFY